MTRTSRLSAGVALVVALVLGVLGSTAVAVWTLTANGDGAAPSGALVAPSVTVEQSATSPQTSLVVKWTAAGQLPGATYTVKRGSTTVSCTSSPCTDSGLTAGQSYTYSVTAALHSWTSPAGTGSGSTSAASATTFVVTAPSTTAGSAGLVTLTAKRGDGTTDTAYSGSKTLTWGGAAAEASPNGTAATVPGSATFANGVASVTVRLTSASTTARPLTVSDGSINGSVSVTVAPAAASSFAVMPSPTTVAVGGAFTMTVTALDAYGNTATGYSGGKSLVWTDGSGGSLSSPSGQAPVLNSNVLFNGGTTSTLNQRLYKAGTGQTIKVTQGALTGTTTMTVTPLAASRLGFTTVSSAGASVTTCLLGCTLPDRGGQGDITTKVSVLDTYGNLTTATAVVNVTVQKSSGTFTPTTPSISIASGATESAGSVKLSDSGNWTSATLTVSAPGLSPNVSATISK